MKIGKVPPNAFRRRRYTTEIEYLYPGESAHILVDPRTGQQVAAVVEPDTGLQAAFLRLMYRIRCWLNIPAYGEPGVDIETPWIGGKGKAFRGFDEKSGKWTPGPH